MNLLEKFLKVVEYLNIKPFEFLSTEVQKEILENGKSAVDSIKELFESKKLVQNSVYRTILVLEASFPQKDQEFDEVSFLQSLSNLIDLYKLSSIYRKNKKLIDDLEKITQEAKKRISEHHIYLDTLEDKGLNLSDEEKEKSDLEIIEKIGIFYILEYTIYLLSGLSKLNKKQRKQAFYDGYDDGKMKLSPYVFYADSFRRELCLKIFNVDFRNKLFDIFFKFEEVFNRGDIDEICLGFKEFNIDLLKVFKGKGIKVFKVALLSSDSQSIEVDKLIEKVEAINL